MAPKPIPSKLETRGALLGIADSLTDAVRAAPRPSAELLTTPLTVYGRAVRHGLETPRAVRTYLHATTDAELSAVCVRGATTLAECGDALALDDARSLSIAVFRVSIARGVAPISTGPGFAALLDAIESAESHGLSEDCN